MRDIYPPHCSNVCSNRWFLSKQCSNDIRMFVRFLHSFACSVAQNSNICSTYSFSFSHSSPRVFRTYVRIAPRVCMPELEYNNLITAIDIGSTIGYGPARMCSRVRAIQSIALRCIRVIVSHRSHRVNRSM